jgi:amidase
MTEPESTMQRIPRSRALVYALDPTLEPVLRVRAGELFAVETEDASSGHLTSGDKPPTPENTPYTAHSPSRSNPVGGPVHVEGVRAGSRVKVEIAGIDLAPWGVAYNQPPFSPLGDVRSFPAGGEYFLVKVEHGPEEAVISERLRWPIWPMVGTLACAPEWEIHGSATSQGPWGGNVDVLDFRPGATVTLMAYHDGALLFAGDVHGCQGDSEYFGTSDESRAEIRLRAWPADGEPIPAPRVETPETIVALGIDRPLERAADAAARHLIAWLGEEFGFSPREALLTVGLNPEFRFRVYQMTATELRYVVGATLPRSFVEQA